MSDTVPYRWWQRGVIYQIYPRSFRDSNADGVGDLDGIIEKLDYLAGLGVDAIWLSPIFPSPMADFGYDVADYTAIHPLFGTLADFDRLIAEARARNLKIILDFVPNHTSDQHPWFRESRSNRTNPKRDWYLWRDAGPDGALPNNWLSHFGGSAWEYDASSGQYYCHSFLKQQPDLNWRNPEVVAAMHDVLRFWLRRGVAGFRIDVLWLLIKDDQWRNNPPNLGYAAGMSPPDAQISLYNADRPEMGAVVAGLRAVADEFDDRVLIGEIYLPLERLMAYYGIDSAGVQMPYNFLLLQSPWRARDVATLIDAYEGALPPGAWPNWVLGNHDKPRIASRIGRNQTRVAAMLLLTLRGTPTLYYGDELGMTNVAIAPDMVQDPFEKNVPGKGLGRDPCRTPMQWDASPYAGFSTVAPWLPVSAEHEHVNVGAEETDPISLLTLYRKLLQLRRQEAALVAGDYRPVNTAGELLAYIREAGGERLLVVLNLGARIEAAQLPYAGEILLSTRVERTGERIAGRFQVEPHEGVIIRCAAP